MLGILIITRDQDEQEILISLIPNNEQNKFK